MGKKFMPYTTEESLFYRGLVNLGYHVKRNEYKGTKYSCKPCTYTATHSSKRYSITALSMNTLSDIANAIDIGGDL